MPLLFPTVRGRNLGEVLGREASKPADLSMLLEIANVLATLHGQGVALGGLHPGMMVLQDTGRVGFSRWSLLEDEEQRDDVRPYLAPEFDKQERPDPTSDVYTLGVILRLIVTGSPTSETTVSRPLFEALIDRATDPDPTKRFGDARVFRDALDGVLRDGGSDETLAAAYDLATSMRKRYRQLNTEAVLARKNGSLDKHKEYVQRIERLHHQLVGVSRCMLSLVPGDMLGQATLVELSRVQARNAERTRDPRALHEAVNELKVWGMSDDAPYLQGHGTVTLEFEPPDVRIELFHVREDAMGRTGEPFGDIFRGPLRDMDIPAGGWIARVSRTGFADCFHSFLVNRAGSYPPVGGARCPPVKMVPAEKVESDSVVVPGGYARIGGDSKAPGSRPGAMVYVPGFIMQRNPVTHEQYLGFLNDLVSQRRRDEARQFMPTLRVDGVEEPLYRKGFAGSYELPPRKEVPFVFETAPVVLVSQDAANAYARWYSVRTASRWRLPTEVQWERAARGGDGRWYPWGDRMLHRGVLTSISAVDRFPDVSEPGMDVSPYGVNLMAGSIREWTCSRWLVQSERHTVFEELRSLAPRLVVKGASFLESHEYSRAAARGWALGTIGHHDVGFRLVKRVE